MFAGDTKLAKEVISTENSSDLLLGITSIFKWSSKSKLSFYVKKYNLLLFYSPSMKSDFIQLNSKWHQITVKDSWSCRSSAQSWNLYHTYITAKAFITDGIVKAYL